MRECKEEGAWPELPPKRDHTWARADEGRTRRRPSVRAVGDKGRRITGGPWGAEQVICLKHEQTEHNAT